MTDTAVLTDIDYEKVGKQTGYFYVPHSPQSDAWGAVAVPIGVVANGEGPTALLISGTHGDEYEGAIVLARMLRLLNPARLQGRLIVLPCLNPPAMAIASRVSPLDGKNLNRCFPGDPTGTVSDQIAYYASHVLFPKADLIIDLHSGGSSLEMIPSAFIEATDDAEHQRSIIDAVLAFNAPLSIFHNVSSQPGTSNAVAVRMGKTFVGAELGGSGSVSIEGLKVAECGVYSTLMWQGLIEHKPRGRLVKRETRLLRTEGDRACVLAPAAGIFEPFCELGAYVEMGMAAGAIHFLDDPTRQPVKVEFKTSGIMFSRRCPGMVVHGSCIAVVGAEERSSK